MRSDPKLTSYMGDPDMAIKFHNPGSISFSGEYSLGVEVHPGARWLHVSGQVGIDAAGKVLPTFEKQALQAWKNVGHVLKSAGMARQDIVKFTTFVTDSRFLMPYRGLRERFLGRPPYPASTLLVVAGLARPELLIEVEVVAARA
jgi:2-iminobutanoate/2-iminopropanoate deaminase